MVVEDYRELLDEELRANVYGTGYSTKEAFLEYVSDLLIGSEISSEFQSVEYEGIGYRQHRLQIDGYVYDELDEVMFLALIDYGSKEITLTNSEIENITKRAKYFLEDLAYILNYAEESSPGYGLASDIFNKNFPIRKYKVYLFSNNKMSNRVKTLEPDVVQGLPLEYHIWDINRLFELAESKNLREDLHIKFDTYSDQLIPCFEVINGESYKGYMASISGFLLANLYNHHGARLLESNVRSFLQVRGKVNKGIRNTIIKEPSKFFAYNNGIACTAEEIVLKEINGKTYLESAINLQIVNGGQTTASLATALLDKKDDLVDNLKNIFVPVKISVVSDENANELIANISRYANSQNKVSESDLASNHPYHVRMEQLSRSTIAPPINGQQYGTYWYYERARGSYAQETHKVSVGTRKNFEIKYPKKQKFDKTELAKLSHVFNKSPEIASAGGQKSFAKFMSNIIADWDRNSDTFNEAYFRELICYKIIFQETDAIVKKAEWYNSYKANIIAYTLSKLISTLEKRYKGKSLNYKMIWQKQRITLAFRQQLEDLTKVTNDYLIAPNRDVQNVTEWAKRSLCWTRFDSMDISLNDNFVRELIDLNEVVEEKQEARKLQKEINIDSAMIMVANCEKEGIWKKLWIWNQTHGAMTQTEQELLGVALKMSKGLFPTDKQCVRLVEMLSRIRGEGFPG